MPYAIWHHGGGGHHGGGVCIRHWGFWVCTAIVSLVCLIVGLSVGYGADGSGGSYDSLAPGDMRMFS